MNHDDVSRFVSLSKKYDRSIVAVVSVIIAGISLYAAGLNFLTNYLEKNTVVLGINAQLSRQDDFRYRQEEWNKKIEGEMRDLHKDINSNFHEILLLIKK